MTARATGCALTDWERANMYGVGEIVMGPNPLTWWDRIRMFFGFNRKSPATVPWECVVDHVSSEDFPDLASGAWRA